MPHFYAECTDNIREEAALPELFAKVNSALAGTGIFPLGAFVAAQSGWILGKWRMANTITRLCI